MLLLDSPHPKERREPLAHDGGQLLRMLINRLSISREDWIHDYCRLEIRDLSSKKKQRLEDLHVDIRRLHDQIQLNQPCIVVGMGKLPCEVLTGASLVSKKAGTSWQTKAFGIVWITYAPEAALFDSALVVDIYGVLASAARMAEIPTRFNLKVPMFDWESYEYYRKI
jgi:hypothetical protein